MFTPHSPLSWSAPDVRMILFHFSAGLVCIQKQNSNSINCNALQLLVKLLGIKATTLSFSTMHHWVDVQQTLMGSTYELIIRQHLLNNLIVYAFCERRVEKTVTEDSLLY